MKRFLVISCLVFIGYQFAKHRSPPEDAPVNISHQAASGVNSVTSGLPEVINASQANAGSAKSISTLFKQGRFLANIKPSLAKREYEANQIREFLNRKYPGNWDFSLDSHGRVTGIAAVGTVPSAKGIGFDRERAKQFARDLAGSLGISAKDIVPSEKGRFSKNNEYLSSRHSFDQVIQGYKIYGGKISILSNKTDGQPVMIHNHLKAVELAEGKLKLSPKLSMIKALAIAESAFQKRSAKAKSQSDDPVVWAQSTPSELAWVFSVRLKDPGDLYEVVVGAQSGLVLAQGTTLRR